jgi:hypothetical protein
MGTGGVERAVRNASRGAEKREGRKVKISGYGEIEREEELRRLGANVGRVSEDVDAVVQFPQFWESCEGAL